VAGQQDDLTPANNSLRCSTGPQEAHEIRAPALLVRRECGFRLGDQIAGSRIQAEGDAAGQNRGSRYELAASCGFSS
jgi:hypothetical protein